MASKKSAVHPSVVVIGRGRFHTVNWAQCKFALESTRGGFGRNALWLKCHAETNAGSGHKWLLVSRYSSEAEYSRGFGAKSVCPRCYYEGRRSPDARSRSTGDAEADAFLAKARQPQPQDS